MMALIEKLLQFIVGGNESVHQILWQVIHYLSAVGAKEKQSHWGSTSGDHACHNTISLQSI